MSSIQSVEYSFRFSGTGALGNIIPAVTGKTSLYLSEESPHPIMILDYLEVEKEGSADWFAVPSSYVASADSFYRFDYTSETVTAAPASQEGSAVFNFPPASVMMELVLNDPFMDELQADSIAVLFPDSIRGVLCHVFQVYYTGESSTEAVWYIGMEDLLPRAVERLGRYGPEGEPGGQFLQVWNIEQHGTLPNQGEEASEVFLADTDGFARRISFPRENPVLFLFFTSGGSNSLSAIGTAAGIVCEELEVYGISVMETTDPLFRLSSLEIPFPILLYGEKAAEDFRVGNLPSAVLVKPSGEVFRSAEGLAEINSEEFTNAADHLSSQ